MPVYEDLPEIMDMPIGTEGYCTFWTLRQTASGQLYLWEVQKYDLNAHSTVNMHIKRTRRGFEVLSVGYDEWEVIRDLQDSDPICPVVEMHVEIPYTYQERTLEIISTCHNCGDELPAGALFCVLCGAAVATTGATHRLLPP